MTLLDSIKLALWAFSPVLSLGAAWGMVALVQRWLAVRRVRRYQMKLLNKRIR